MRKLGAIVTLLSILSGVTAAAPTVDRLEGELSPKTYDEYAFDAEYGKPAEFKARFRPKNVRDRSEEDCARFSLRLYVAGKWHSTVTGTYVYVEEAPGREVLSCVATIWFGHTRKNARQRVELRLVNQNIFLTLWTLDSNYSLTPTEP